MFKTCKLFLYVDFLIFIKTLMTKQAHCDFLIQLTVQFNRFNREVLSCLASLI